MKKKLPILILIFVFFLSTTSLPVSLHMCRMMETTSVEECGMCTSGKNSKEIKGFANLKSDRASSCCSSELIDTTIKDNFLSNKVNQQDFDSIKILVSVISSNDIYKITTAPAFADNDNSPPRLLNNNLYLSNSVLLI